jgi:hypothetical protein
VVNVSQNVNKHFFIFSYSPEHTSLQAYTGRGKEIWWFLLEYVVVNVRFPCRTPIVLNFLYVRVKEPHDVTRRGSDCNHPWLTLLPTAKKR